jgi:type IV pilus assembly protein PilB
MADPLDIQAIDEVELRTGYPVEVVVASASQVRYAIEKYLVASDALSELQSTQAAWVDPHATLETEMLLADVPVVKIINQILREAVVSGASDVHVEPTEKDVRVRYRVDGVLHDAAALPKSSQASVTVRLKVLADLDITERRRPLEGRMSMTIDDDPVDIRVATYPTLYGESFVLRVLNSGVAFRPLDDLGMQQHSREAVERMLAKPYGALFVSGPTGSGKSTTLYALLSLLNQPERKIITIEDPIEYRMDGLSQIAVNHRIGLTFSAGLRSILRSDPDVVMVGEVRDPDTASITIRTALTGHLVVTSLHTNDAPSALTRLEDLGVEPFVTSSAMLGVVAQRLVRRLCVKCARPTTIERGLALAAGFLEEELPEIRPMEAVGCESCRGTGYRGRVGLYEVMEMNEDLVRLHLESAPAESLRAVAIASGMRTLRRDGLDKVAMGVTTLNEVARVVY